VKGSCSVRGYRGTQKAKKKGKKKVEKSLRTVPVTPSIPGVGRQRGSTAKPVLSNQPERHQHSKSFRKRVTNKVKKKGREGGC